MAERTPLVSNGWNLFAHPEFSGPLEELVGAVDELAVRLPESYTSHPKAKLLRRILDLILREIPRDPNAAEYQLGNTMGAGHRHWRRAKFLGRFRLFFRFSSAHRVIVYAWVNDEMTLRKAGSKTDPYVIFTRKLQEGNPPDDLNQLLHGAGFLDPSKSRRR